MPATFLAALALLAWGCAASAPVSPSSATSGVQADTLVAGVSVIREPGGGGSVFVVLPSEAPEASPRHPARLTVPGAAFEVPFDELELDIGETPPRVTLTYRAAEDAIRAMDAAGSRALLYVHDGTAYRPYRIRRTDTIE